MQVKNVMSREFAHCVPTDLVVEAAESMRILDIGCLPVLEDRAVVGIITLKDITERRIQLYLHEKVRDIMTTPVICIHPESPISNALDLFEKNQIRRLPVIQDNQIVGFLTKSEIPQEMTHYSHGLQERPRPFFQSST